MVLLPRIAAADPLPNPPCDCGNPYYLVTEVPATGAPGLNPSNLAAPIVGVDNPQLGETIEVAADGGVFVSGGAQFFGSLPGLHIKPSAPIVGMATMGCCGYWLVGADGGVFAFDEAGFYGSLPGLHVKPSSPIVGMALTNDLSGYWLVGADGGVYAFGDARFFGSLPGLGIKAAAPIVGMADDGLHGYVLVGSDGGVFCFGDASFVGSESGVASSPAIAILPVADGYAVVNSDQTVRDFGSFHTTNCPVPSSPLSGQRPRRMVAASLSETVSQTPVACAEAVL